MQIINKNIVRQRFMQTAKSYDLNAIAQKEIAHQLLTRLSAFSFSSDTMLEVGCGSGFLTKPLLSQFTFQKIILNDLYPIQNQLEQHLNGTNYSFIEGDAETIDWDTTFDLILSASTIQWFDDPCHFFKKCFDTIRPNGIFAFSTFSPNNFHEIEELTGVGLNYKTVSDLKQSLSPYFEILDLYEDKLTLNFQTPREVLKHISTTGVNGLSSKRWTKSSLAHFIQEYELKFKTSCGVTLTYAPIYIVARKKH